MCFARDYEDLNGAVPIAFVPCLLRGGARGNAGGGSAPGAAGMSGGDAGAASSGADALGAHAAAPPASLVAYLSARMPGNLTQGQMTRI